MMPPMDLSAKNFDEPDEVVRLPGLLEEVVEVGGFVVGRETVDPGWRWSKDTKPIVGGEWCEAHHIGLTVSGRWGVVLKDGRTLEFRPGDVFEVPAGHESWTVGDEPCVTINWTGLRTFFASKALFPERFLATILFTDLVGSTARASELGDTVWTDLLAHLEQTVRGELERTRGREVRPLATACSPSSTARPPRFAARRRSERRPTDRGFGSAPESTLERSSLRGATSVESRCMRRLGSWPPPTRTRSSCPTRHAPWRSPAAWRSRIAASINSRGSKVRAASTPTWKSPRAPNRISHTTGSSEPDIRAGCRPVSGRWRI